MTKFHLFLQDSAEYTFGLLHWLGNRTYRPGTYSLNLPKLTHKGFVSLPDIVFPT